MHIGGYCFLQRKKNASLNVSLSRKREQWFADQHQVQEQQQAILDRQKMWLEEQQALLGQQHSWMREQLAVLTFPRLPLQRQAQALVSQQELIDQQRRWLHEQQGLLDQHHDMCFRSNKVFLSGQSDVFLIRGPPIQVLPTAHQYVQGPVQRRLIVLLKVFAVAALHHSFSETRNSTVWEGKIAVIDPTQSTPQRSTQ